jgi:hypothetical protein
MAEPTLQEVFGSNATQTATTITINKSDLAIVGLTASATNTAESLITALTLMASRSLTETNRASDTANRNVTLSYNGQDLIDQGTAGYFRRDIYSLLLYKTTALQTVNPNDY